MGGKKANRYLSSSEREKIKEVKEEICFTIKRYALRKRWSQKELAQCLGTSEANASRLVRIRTESLSFNQLFTYLVVLDLRFQILIAI